MTNLFEQRLTLAFGFQPIVRTMELGSEAYVLRTGLVPTRISGRKYNISKLIDSTLNTQMFIEFNYSVYWETHTHIWSGLDWLSFLSVYLCFQIHLF